jgi:hypothetical protein
VENGVKFQKICLFFFLKIENFQEKRKTNTFFSVAARAAKNRDYAQFYVYFNKKFLCGMVF